MKQGYAIAARIVVLAIAGCESSSSNKPEKLPTHAINITDKGNGWTTFELDGIKYLYHRSYNGNLGYEAITAIPSE